MRKFFIVTVIAVLSILLFNDCANTGTPSGGEKDTLAPVVKKMNPENLSTDFEEKKIRVIFNEFVQLNEMEKNMYVSPPLKEKPEITTKGKGIQIKISDTLKPNTTYSINFGEAIGDYTENNPISNFRYVFSTGENIDSLWLLGQINNSWTLLPEEKIFIGLYKNLNDSAPFLGKPDFLSKSDKDGLFNFSYIHEGVFRLFALKDNNSNLTYEAGEDIAFFNQIIKIDTSGFKLLDNDLNPIEYKDTSGAILPDYNIFESHSYIDNVLKHAELLRLNLFMEDKEHQFILEDKRDKENKILLKFNSSHKDELKIALIDSVYAPEYILMENDEEFKEFTLWITDTIVAQKDSVYLSVEYFKTDSIYNLVSQTDTMLFRFIHKEKKEKKEKKSLFGKKEEKKEKIVLKLTNNLSGGKLELGKNFEFNFEGPLSDIDTSKIVMTVFGEDTLAQKFILEKDSVTHTKYYALSEWKPDTKYAFDLLPGAFTDFYYITNDTTNIKFSTRKEEEYGTIHLSLLNVDKPYMFMLLDDKEKLVSEYPVSSDTLLTIPFLKPVKYIFKAYEDVNENHKWDVGNYLKGKQAEKAIYYMPSNEIEAISIKANWENEITWDFKN